MLQTVGTAGLLGFGYFDMAFRLKSEIQRIDDNKNYIKETCNRVKNKMSLNMDHTQRNSLRDY